MPNYILLKTSILDVLRYFHIFKFPLTSIEIHRFCGMVCKLEEVESVLEELLKESILYKIDSNYLLEKSPNLVVRKEKGAQIAHKKFKEAYRAARIINLFPFVRMVSLSGSLSKGYFEEGSDIDFFIITSKNRLWICRSILHLFKKLTFLVGKQHNYCMNYFIDENALEISEKNQFTAIEIVTLVPFTNIDLYDKFIHVNSWVEKFAPNALHYSGGNTISYSKNYFKRIMEKFLDSNKLNLLLMQLTDKKWRSKWSRKGFDMSKYDSAFKTTLHVSKNHPNDFQNKVLVELTSQKSFMNLPYAKTS